MTKDCFQNDCYVFASWESPSKNGLKGLVLLDFDFPLNNNIDLAHKSAFFKLYNYFKENYNVEIDVSGSDITRLCFFRMIHF